MSGEHIDTAPLLPDPSSVLAEQRRLAEARIQANAELLDGIPPDIPIDHTALRQASRDIGQRVMEANSSL